MRLTDFQIDTLRQLAREIAGQQARVRVFGSRLDDHAQGGDLDLMRKSTAFIDAPALVAARLSARVSRLLHGRHVDVLLLAPNLKSLPIHKVALKYGEPI